MFTSPLWHLGFLYPRDPILSYVGSHESAKLACMQQGFSLRHIFILNSCPSLATSTIQASCPHAG